MSKSFIIMEFNKISRGYELTNNILLNYPVEIYKLNNICPGKLLVIIGGQESDIKAISALDEKDMKSQPVFNVSPSIVEALVQKKDKKDIRSLLIGEFRTVGQGIYGADLAYKNNLVEVYRLDLSLGLFGKSIVYFSGQVADLKNCQKDLEKNLSSGQIVNLALIERPRRELLEKL